MLVSGTISLAVANRLCIMFFRKEARIPVFGQTRGSAPTNLIFESEILNLFTPNSDPRAGTGACPCDLEPWTLPLNPSFYAPQILARRQLFKGCWLESRPPAER